jgi:putative PEP-CTERM system TPR-repeat lipoprotein
MPTPLSFAFANHKARHAAVAAVFVAFGLGSPHMASAVDAKASKYYEDALQRYEKKDMPGAIIQLKNALQIDKNMLPVQTLLGKAYLRNGDPAAAADALAKAIQLGVNRAEVILPLAQAYMAQSKHKLLFEQEQFALAGLPPAVQSQLLLLRADASSFLGNATDAVGAIKEARALEPNSPDSWLAEVPLRIRGGQFKEANEAAERAVALAPGSAEAWYQKGAAAHVSGKLPSTLSHYDHALKIDAEHKETRIARAGLYIDLNRLPEASADVEELKRTAPKEPRSAYLRALLAERAGKPELAKEALKQVTTLIDPLPVEFMRYRPQLLMLNGLAHFGLNERDQAQKFLELFQQQQTNTAASKLLAQIYLDNKNADRAIQVLEAYLKANPADGQAMTLLGSALLSKGQYIKASGLMRQALEAKDNPAFRTVLGLSLLQRGQTATGQAELETAYRQDAMQTQAAVGLISLYLHSGQADQAVPIASRLVKQQAANAGLFNLLGMAQAQAGKPAEARVAFEQAAKLNGAWPQPKINLARLDIATGAYEAAAKRLAAILALDAKNAEAMFELFALAERQGRLPDAQRWLEKANDVADRKETQYGIALSGFHLRHGSPGPALAAIKAVSGKAPEDVPTLLAYAKAQLANGNIPSAKATLSNATKFAESSPALQVEIALLQLSAQNVAGATLSLGKAFSSEPDFLPAQALMTDVELRLGEPNKAEKRARAIIAKHPKRAIGYSLLGDVAVAQGKPAAAMSAYQQAHQLEPGSDTLLRLFRLTNNKDGAKGATPLALAWLKAHPGDAQVQSALADAYARSGDFAAARGAYQRLLSINPNDGAALNNLSNVLMALNDPGALPMAERAVAQSPTSANAIDTLGWALHRAGQADRALQLLRDARLRAPDNPELRYHLAVVLAKSGRKNEAREELEAALKHGPVFEAFADAATLLKSL